MAFFGSPATQLSPLFSKGDLFSEGVNILIHNDISKSMNVYPYGSSTFNTISDFNTGTGTGGVELNSMFYDGTIVEQLQTSLLSFGVGADTNASPNIYSYFDVDLRNNTSTFVINRGSESATYDSYFLKGVTGSGLKSTWDTYIKSKPGFFNTLTDLTSGNPLNPTNYAFKVIRSGVTNINTLNVNSDITLRLTGVNLTNYQLTEDVHGVLMSLFYLDNNTSRPVFERIETGLPGIFARNFFADKFRRKNKTFVITASNEQESSGPDMVGLGVSVTDNVGTLEYDRTEYLESGLYAKRYFHYFLDNGVSDYGGEDFILDSSSNDTPVKFRNAISKPVNLKERMRLRYNQLISNTTLRTGGLTANLTNLDGSGATYFTYLLQQYNIDKSNNVAYTNPSSIQYVPYLSGNNNTEEFGRYFDLIAAPWPTGNANLAACNNTLRIPETLNPFDSSALQNYIQSQGNGNWSSELVNFPGVTYGVNTTLLDPLGADKSEGIINNIDRLRSDIPNYSIMVFGYFVPKETGSHTFRIDSNEVAFLWFGETAVSRDADGISNWTGDTAQIRTKTKTTSEHTQNNFTASAATGANNGDTGSVYTVTLTKDIIYPIRILMGNRSNWVQPGGTGIGWAGSGTGAWPSGRTYQRGGSSTANYNNYLTSSGAINSSATNSSFCTLSFSVPSTPTTFITDGTGYFYGGRKVSQLGSEFNPFIPNRRIITVIDELNRRNISVIALSNYESPSTSTTKDYDGVFFPPSGTTYRYVKFLTPTTISITNLSTAPDWIPSEYFKPIPYFLSQSNGDFTLASGVTGSGLQLTVNRNNTSYEGTIINGGDGFKKGDRLTVNRSIIGNTGTNFVFDVTSVQPRTYTLTGTNFVSGDSLGSGAKFTISKTTGSTGTVLGYSVTKVASGTNYQDGDRLVINGVDLDGDATNDLRLQVLSVSGGGATGPINAFQIGYDGGSTPTPSDRIVYGKTAGLTATYNPKSITGGIKYETFGISNISYEHYDITGIAYTTITNSQIAGIAYTASSISNVGYTTLPIVSIGYTAPTITSIGYSSPNVVSIGYTFGTISNISYPSVRNIVSIGYTTPSILSIGHTSFDVNSIEWITSRTLDSAFEVGGGGGNTKFTLAASETGLGKTLGLAQGDRVIFYNVKDPDESYSLSQLYDNSIFTVTNVISNTEFEIDVVTSTGPSRTQNFNYPSGPLTKYLCISKPETDLVNSSGLSSSVQITTSSNHSFQIGNEVILYGSNALLFNGTRFVVDSVPSPTAFTLAGTGTTELFTSGISTLTQSGTTKAGYYSSTLEIQFKTEFNLIGISSISYDLSDPGKSNSFTPSRYYFENVRTAGTLGPDRRVQFRNDTSTSGGDSYSSPNSPFKTGDQIYIFGVSNNGGPSGIDFNTVNSGGDIVGYGLTVQSVGVRFIEVYFRNLNNFADVFSTTSPIYAIKKNSIPFVKTNLAHGLKSGDIVTITENQNDRYNKSFKVNSVGSATTFTLGDFTTGLVLTTEQLLTSSGNENSSNGNVGYTKLSSTEVRVNAGDTIDIFGNSNSTYNLNNATLVSLGNTSTYRFGLNTPIIPTTLTDGLGGNVGLPNIVGIITTSSAHNYGSAGTIVGVKIYNTSTGFDKDYNNSIVLDSTRIQLGSGSIDPQSFYDPDNRAYNPPETGKVFLLGSLPRITLTSGQTFQGLGFVNNTTVDLQNTVNFNSTNSAIIDNISGNTADLRNISNPTNPDVTSTSGQIGLRNSPANVTISFPKTLQELRIGNIGDTAIVDIQNTSGGLFNGDNQSIRIYGPYTFGLVGRTNPTSYTTSSNVGRIGFKNMPGIGTITGNLQTLGFGNPGSETLVRIQRTNSSFDNSDNQQTIRIYSATEFGTLFTGDPVDHTETYSGNRGILGLQNSPPIVTVSGNLQTAGFGNVGNTFNSRIQNTGISTFNINDTSTILSSTTFSLPGAVNPTEYLSSYSSSGNPLQAVVGLRGSSLVVTTTSPHEFIATNSVELQNTNNYDGTYTVSSVLDPNRIALNLTMTTGTNIVNSTNGTVGLRDFPATVRLNVAIPSGIINGSSIRLENTGVTQFNGTQTVSNIDFQRRLFTLSGVTNPTNFAVTSSSNTNRIIGLNAPPTVTTSASHALTDSSNITIYGATDGSSVGFNQQFNQIRVYSPTQFGLINPSVSNPSSFINANSGSGGVIGVNFRNAIVNTSTTHPFKTGDNIRINGSTITDSGITSGVGTDAIAANYNSTYRITVETPTRFRLNSTSLNNQPNASTTYDDVATGGYFVGVTSEALVTLSDHGFPNGSTIQVSGTSQSYFNGNFTVKTVDTNNFYLAGTISPPSNNYTITSAANIGLATLTSGAGSGAGFRVNRTWIASGRASYSGITTAYVNPSTGVVDWFTPGQSYRVGDVLRISGNLLGGKVPTHDAIFRVSEVSQSTNTLLPNYRPAPSGQILTIGDITPGTGLAQGETADPAMDYSDSTESLIQFDGISVAGTGNGASFTVVREGETTYKISLSNGGLGYGQNDEINIPGASVGGNNIDNNIRITVLSVNTSGTIRPGVGIGFTYTGTASLSNPISGITTVSGSPEGIENTGRTLKQTQNTLKIADDTNGGLFKISNVYSLGSFSNFKLPEIIYWPAVTTLDYNTNGSKGSLFFDTIGATGIATILFNNSATDDNFFVDFKLGDEVMIFGTGSRFVDYDKVGYAHTIVGINSSTSLPYGPNNTIGTVAGNDNYDSSAGTRYQWISIRTGMTTTVNNKNENFVNGSLISGSGGAYDRFIAQFGPSVVDNILRTDENSGNTLPLNQLGFNGAIINANIDARVYSAAHGFTTSVTIDASSVNSGFAKSTYSIALERYLLNNLYTDIRQNPTYPIDNADLITALDVGTANHFRIVGFTPKRYLSSQVYNPSSILNGSNPQKGPRNFIVAGGVDVPSGETGVTLSFPAVATPRPWHPPIPANNEIDNDGSREVVACRLSKAVISYDPFDRSKPGIYVGISTVDNRVAFAKAVAQYISGN